MFVVARDTAVNKTNNPYALLEVISSNRIDLIFYMKRCFTSLVYREMHITTTMRYPYIKIIKNLIISTVRMRA